MALWFLLTLMCGAAAIVISIPMLRRHAIVGSSMKDTAIYEDQLNEVDNDFAIGAINRPEADLAKVEIQRRIAAYEKGVSGAQPLSATGRKVVLAATSGLIVLGSVGLYSVLGSPNLLPSRAQEIVETGVAASTGSVEELIAKLSARLQGNPQDAEGWRMLGWAQFSLQRYAESAEAYARALAAEPNNSDYKSAYAEALVQQAEGIVTPKALGLIAEVLAKAPKDSRARFYDALGHEQAGDQTGALGRWLALLADSPADAGWRGEVKLRIAKLAQTTGRDVGAALAEPTVPPPQSSLGKNEMVAGMIAKLAAKLADNPNDRDGWAMLIRSLIVSGDAKGAKDALEKALDVFKDDKATIDVLKAVALEAAQGAN